MHSSTVVLTRCQSYEAPALGAAVDRQLELLGGLESFVKPGNRVLIKPNFIAPKPIACPAQTHPALIIEVARRLKDMGAHPFVGDSPAWGSVDACAEALNLTEPLARLGVPLKQLNCPRACSIGRRKTSVGISSVALDADAIINLPKFKAHQQLTGTFAIKNMFGCVSGKAKPYWHYARGASLEKFSSFLIDICQCIPPAFTLIDGISAMEGAGPIGGSSYALGWIIGGTDPIACELMCAQLIDQDPELFPIIRTARSLQYGCSQTQHIMLKGDDPSQGICSDFRLPELIPLRFSLGRVVKSIVKGLLGKL
jgi:uncharacterized protein (DUF362 family)